MSRPLTSIGFTGTQIGMNDKQKKEFRELIIALNPRFFHHGDCIGADKEAHDIVRESSPLTAIIIHPPEKNYKRANCKADAVRPSQDYMTRNQNIVNECETIIATPKSNKEELRSGTWATIRRAKKGWRTLHIIFP